MEMLIAAAAVSAAGCAATGVWGWQQHVQSRKRSETMRRPMADAARPAEAQTMSGGLSRVVVQAICAQMAHQTAAGRLTIAAVRAGPVHLGTKAVLRLERGLAKAGVAGRAGGHAAMTVAMRCSAIGLAAGLLIGGLIGAAAMLLFGVAGLAVGAMAVPWALRQEAAARTAALERELPDMLDIVALGLRSGLTFDLSFRLYPEFFDTPFARECDASCQRWLLGVATRKAALEELAASYDSALFAHVVQSILQSIRLGTSLSDDLARTAQEARDAYKVKQEESVAKAPVKMMIPIGTMILPAMLLMVMGPVLLQIMSSV